MNIKKAFAEVTAILDDLKVCDARSFDGADVKAVLGEDIDIYVRGKLYTTIYAVELEANAEPLELIWHKLAYVRREARKPIYTPEQWHGMTGQAYDC